MQIQLTHEQEAWLKAVIADGHFASAEDAIAFAINEAKRAALVLALSRSIAGGGINSAEDARRHVRARLAKSKSRKVVRGRGK